MPPADPVCATCKWWDRSGHVYEIRRMVEDIQRDGYTYATAECHALPPSIGAEKGQARNTAYWPTTAGAMWCAAHKPRKEFAEEPDHA